MILQKGTNEKTRISYEEGDSIVYQQEGNEFFVSDRINEIHQEFLVLSENILKPEKIAAVDIRDKEERNYTLNNLTGLLVGGGALLLLAETINGFYHQGKLTYSTEGLVISGSLLASGFILSKIRYKYFRVKGRKKIRIIPLEEEEEND